MSIIECGQLEVVMWLHGKGTTQRSELFTDLLDDKVKISAVSVAAFPPAKFDQALIHLDLLAHRAAILAELKRLELEVPFSLHETLRLIF
jgi:hypothetical protein